MAKTVVMPQMGESVAEGTIVRWLKKVGDAVERDEPLFEISTDKVDAEIPSPSAGVLSEVKVQEGATVPINTVVAVIDETSASAAKAPVAATARQGPAPKAPSAPAAPVAPAAPEVPVSSPQGDGDSTGRFGPYAPTSASASAPPASPGASTSAQSATADRSARQARATTLPVTRRAA